MKGLSRYIVNGSRLQIPFIAIQIAPLLNWEYFVVFSAGLGSVSQRELNGAIHSGDLDGFEIDLSQKRSECKRSKRAEIDLNESEIGSKRVTLSQRPFTLEDRSNCTRSISDWSSFALRKYITLV